MDEPVSETCTWTCGALYICDYDCDGDGDGHPAMPVATSLRCHSWYTIGAKVNILHNLIVSN